VNIPSGHFTLTEAQRQFKKTLDHHPRLVPFWDFDKRECKVDDLRDAIPAMSHGEQIMAKFMMGVWCGENVGGFDLIEAVRSLDETQLAIITDWMKKPEFP